MTVFDFSILVTAFLLSVIESKKVKCSGNKIGVFHLLEKTFSPQNYICAMLIKTKEPFWLLSSFSFYVFIFTRAHIYHLNITGVNNELFRVTKLGFFSVKYGYTVVFLFIWYLLTHRRLISLVNSVCKSFSFHG